MCMYELLSVAENTGPFYPVKLLPKPKRSNQKLVSDRSTTVFPSRCLPVGAAVSTYQDDEDNKKSRIESMRLQTLFTLLSKIQGQLSES